jgi:hypothetical protein
VEECRFGEPFHGGGLSGQRLHQRIPRAETFDETAARWSRQYADRNERGHAALAAAVRTGRLAAQIRPLTSSSPCYPADTRAKNMMDPPSSSASEPKMIQWPNRLYRAIIWILD